MVPEKGEKSTETDGAPKVQFGRLAASVFRAKLLADVSLAAQAVYAAICLFADRNWRIDHVGHLTLANIVGLHPGNVSEAVAELERAHLIRIIFHPGRGNANGYIVNSDPDEILSARAKDSDWQKYNEARAEAKRRRSEKNAANGRKAKRGGSESIAQSPVNLSAGAIPSDKTTEEDNNKDENAKNVVVDSLKAVEGNKTPTAEDEVLGFMAKRGVKGSWLSKKFPWLTIAIISECWHGTGTDASGALLADLVDKGAEDARAKTEAKAKAVAALEERRKANPLARATRSLLIAGRHYAPDAVTVRKPDGPDEHLETADGHKIGWLDYATVAVDVPDAVPVSAADCECERKAGVAKFLAEQRAKRLATATAPTSPTTTSSLPGPAVNDRLTQLQQFRGAKDRVVPIGSLTDKILDEVMEVTS